MDGTCTGEHGVGCGKIPYLPLQLGDEAVELMQTMKKAIDPHCILNPGKVVPEELEEFDLREAWSRVSKGWRKTFTSFGF